ncbi:hypothetical protein O181_047104, partial [Austropuccinia psidii MF-1]|nr:hypothetical protein [Austropuccinia psidii MF-1]
SSIEAQTSPAPRAFITKEPFKGPAEVEVTTPSHQMDLDQDIKVINSKDKNVSPDERQKWRMPELPPVPKDIQSSINNTSLSNYLPRHSSPILDINVLNFINDLHHITSSNAEVETDCSFNDIPRLEEWPTFSGEVEYNNMEFMKTVDMFKADFNIPDEYITATLH